jgi:hypothetical protein
LWAALIELMVLVLLLSLMQVDGIACPKLDYAPNTIVCRLPAGSGAGLGVAVLAGPVSFRQVRVRSSCLCSLRFPCSVWLSGY